MPKKKQPKLKVGDYVRMSDTWRCTCDDCSALRGKVSIVTYIYGTIMIRVNSLDGEHVVDTVPSNHFVKDTFLSAAAEANRQKSNHKKPKKEKSDV